MNVLNYTVLAALLYSVLLLLCANSPNRTFRYGIPLVAVWVSVSFAASLLFALQASVYIGLNYLLYHQRIKQVWLRVFFWLVWIGLSAGFITHTLPGYAGLSLADHEQVKSNSLAVSVYLNTDKVLIAWALLQWLPLWRKSRLHRSVLPTGLITLLPLMGIPLILWAASQVGLIHWQPEVSWLIGVIIISNLINTCFAEELLFRGVLQQWLQVKLGATAAVLIASSVFGIAHFAGGSWYVLLAILAGLLYGLVYIVTGRLLWAILCHWGLNVTHILLLTWPLVKPG